MSRCGCYPILRVIVMWVKYLKKKSVKFIILSVSYSVDAMIVAFGCEHIISFLLGNPFLNAGLNLVVFVASTIAYLYKCKKARDIHKTLDEMFAEKFS